VFIKTASGRRYASLFYRHAPELTGLLRGNAALQASCRRVLEGAMPALGFFAADNDPKHIARVARQADTLMDEFKRAASPELQKTLTRLQEDIRNNSLLHALSGGATSR
jgi:hypothetical protein